MPPVGFLDSSREGHRLHLREMYNMLTEVFLRKNTELCGFIFSELVNTFLSSEYKTSTLL